MTTIEFLGAEFRLTEKVGRWAVMRLAKTITSGAAESPLAALSALHDVILTLVHPDDRQRFEAHAEDTAADEDQLVQFIADALEVLTERPTSRPSDSSDGPQNTEPKSTGDSSSPVIQRLERQGRPDLALMVDRAVKARATA